MNNQPTQQQLEQARAKAIASFVNTTRLLNVDENYKNTALMLLNESQSNSIVVPRLVDALVKSLRSQGKTSLEVSIDDFNKDAKVECDIKIGDNDEFTFSFKEKSKLTLI